MTPIEACPDLDEIERLVAEQLDAGPSARIRAHLTTCVSCSRQIDELRADRDLGERLRRALGGVNDERLPQIEGYRVLREVGRGGMGVVYEAEQISPKRRVALKVVRGAQFVDAHTLKLFQREIRVLARLEHPGIASLYEAGETQGEHWFAMELVNGKPLTLHARALGIDDKLDRFLQLCDAIDHAHRHGVVHRDLKPSNVLVTDAGRVQVLDFGLAKITDADVSLVTEAGHIRGTLAYMSPEQARGDPSAIGLQSDVYSLGVLLYELLCDALPIDTSGVAIHEAARRVVYEAPRRPSAIVHELRGDLETIVLKALEKDAHRRYAGAAALAEDVRRFRANEVILARPPSAAYELRKLVSRHRLPFALASIVLVGAVGTAIWTTMLYQREADLLTAQSKLTTEREQALSAEKAERLRAVTASEEASRQTGLAEVRLERMNEEVSARDESLAFFIDVFRDLRSKDGTPNQVSADEILARGIARLAARKGMNESIRVTLLSTVGSAARRAGLIEEAAKLLEEGVELARRAQQGQPILGTLLAELGMLRAEQGRKAESVELLKESELVFTAVAPKSKNSIAARSKVARSLYDSGNSRRAAELARSTLKDNEAHPEAGDTRIALQGLLGLALYDLDEFDEARTLLVAAVAEHEGKGPSPGLATLIHVLGMVHYSGGRGDEARERFQKALDMRLATLAADDDALADSYNALAAITKDPSAALKLYAKATAVQVRCHGAESAQVATCELHRARILLSLKDFDAASELADHALAVRRACFGNDSVRVAECLVLTADVALARKDTASAEAAFRDAARIFEYRMGKPHPLTLQARFRLVQCLLDAQRFDDARTLMAEVQVVAATSKQINAGQAKAVEELAKRVKELAGDGNVSSAAPAGDDESAPK